MMLLLMIVAAWVLVLGWLVSPWLELAGLLFWTLAVLYALERDWQRRRGRRPS